MPSRPSASPSTPEPTAEIERRRRRRFAPAVGGIRLPLDRRSSAILTGLVVGAAGGLGAVAYRALIELVQDLAWGPGQGELARIHRATFLMVLLLPAVGGLAVGLVTRYLAPEAKGHGVPEVMYAVARKGGIIRPVVVLAKAVASAVCIATGGSAGREGPIVQIGAALGSTFAQWVRLPASSVRTAVACGAAAGIAGTFNAPIAGAFFASEVILGHFETHAFSAIVISSVTSTAVARSFLGDTPAFAIPPYEIRSAWELVTFALLGLAAAGAGVLYIRLLAWMEDRFDTWDRAPAILRPAVGGLLVGLLGLAVPEVMGVGYDGILGILHGQYGLLMLLVLLGGKMIATSLTLGSGGSGGVFAPSLVMGAALGAAVGTLAGAVFDFPMGPPGAYAVVGMGAMVAAATHAPITAILILFEMTGDYRVILGLMVACTIGTLLAQRLERESIYTIKLSRRGIQLESGTQRSLLHHITVREVMRRDMELVQPDTPVSRLLERMVESPHYEFLVGDRAGRLQGLISVDDLRHDLPRLRREGEHLVARDLMDRNPITVREDDTLDVAMERIGRRTYEEIPVLPAEGDPVPIGVIRRDDVINAYNKAALEADLEGELSRRIARVHGERIWETIGDFVLTRMEVPPHMVGRSLADLALRDAGIEVVLIQRGDGEPAFPSADTVLEAGDALLVLGRRKDVLAFQAGA